MNITLEIRGFLIFVTMFRDIWMTSTPELCVKKKKYQKMDSLTIGMVMMSFSVSTSHLALHSSCFVGYGRYSARKLKFIIKYPIMEIIE